MELLNICPEGDPVSLITLWLTTALVNTHIRRVRPYARERHVLTQLSLLTGEYLATVLSYSRLNPLANRIPSAHSGASSLTLCTFPICHCYSVTQAFGSAPTSG